ncbi:MULTISPECIES: ATP-binding protein [unclassified Streptomyces]|uniref:ATP-binding protein n=1 Tax=unclassified Streptomyces TaxID=2593676 RepID=UPI0008DF41F5|nr:MULTISPECIES: bifunctional GNAT family N-acetyltransferase/ATP-binding protein [unclassified Streptomyces]MDX2732558.1 bifunctional GNAT family N-acetyltransferase/ATP-binding protein [Streptomyces sp. PA03-2a]SFT31004.1 Acetyltransferase (GNAT) family protein [Streptomyces sp. ok210]
MTGWFVRDYSQDDLEAVILLDMESGTTGEPPLFQLSDTVAALQALHPAVVAMADDVIIGAAVSRVEGDRAWILRICMAPSWRHRGLGSALITTLEHRLFAGGVRTVHAVLPEGETGAAALHNCDFDTRSGLVFFEKRGPVTPQAIGMLAALGAELPPGGLWQKVAGMEREKRLIERRLVLPLAHPELAAQHGVELPRAVMLFGPPGTGKSTFAHAIASRLGWPFVELFPARLAAEYGLAAGLNRRFDEIAQLDHALVFIDEVEEIAVERTGADPTAVGIVNELLKAIVRFRSQDGRLLVCATNNVTTLDPAFLRHGRFDYVLPIGPPDHTARAALWGSYLARAGAEADNAALASASEGFTPADIAHAARTVSQSQFERTIDTGTRARPTTDDYLETIGATKPTVSSAMAQEFSDQSDKFARI